MENDYLQADGHTFEKQYKEVLSGFRDWDQMEHADKWLLFPDNIGPRIAIDKSSLSNGKLYTFVTNRNARTREMTHAECSQTWAKPIAAIAGATSPYTASPLGGVREGVYKCCFSIRYYSPKSLL